MGIFRLGVHGAANGGAAAAEDGAAGRRVTPRRRGSPDSWTPYCIPCADCPAALFQVSGGVEAPHPDTSGGPVTGDAIGSGGHWRQRTSPPPPHGGHDLRHGYGRIAFSNRNRALLSSDVSPYGAYIERSSDNL